MRKLSSWATPLVIGAFMVMATTGVLMFFHLERGLNKQAHEWLGWAMIAGALAHVFLNWTAFKRYFKSAGAGRYIMAAFTLVLVASFFSLPGGKGEEKSPPILAFEAVVAAPISALAPLSGKTEAQMLQDLQAAGFTVAHGGQSLALVAGDERKAQAKALRAVLSAAR